MTTKIITKNSQTPASVPLTGDLEVGELAVNTADQLLYTKQTDGTIIEVGKTTELETLKAPKASPVFTGDAEFQGNVGINDTNPQSKLQVVDDERADAETLNLANAYTVDATGDSVGVKFFLYRGYAGSTNLGAFIQAEKENAWDSSANRNSALVFGTRLGASGPTEAMRINSAGNVGIGTTAPVQPLHLIGNMRIDNGLIDMRGTGIRQLNFQNGIAFTETGVAERVRIDSTGDVEVTTLNKGVIVKSPNGTRWRITVDNAGNIATATV
jgi:hypothetical protein